VTSTDPHISVVVPSRNERDNVKDLHAQLSAALSSYSWEMVFVDDSDDGTDSVIGEISATDERVRCLHRRRGHREGGLGGAVIQGCAIARGEVMVVMDADLQHPPLVVPHLVRALDEKQADIAVASRYVRGGSSSGLDGWSRRLASRGCRAIAYVMLPSTRGITDPLGGFFAVRRQVLAGAELKPDGYKILLEVLVRCRHEGVAEVSYDFAPRNAGSSKSGITEAGRYLRHLRVLRGAARDDGPPEASWTPRPQADAVRAMRVLVLTSEAPPVISGISSTVAALTTGLTERGHVVDVISRADFPRFMRRELRLSAFALFWPKFRKELHHYDVVNVHGPVPTISEVFLFLSRTVNRAHRPGIVYTHHSDLAIPRLERWCAIYNKLTGRLAHTADVVVVSSKAYKEKLVRVQGSTVEVVPWGVDFRTKLQPRDPRVDGRLRILFVGQLRPYKGVNVLIDAISQLPMIDLTIVGEGPSRSELEADVARRGLSNVRFDGRVSDAELWRAYSRNDVVVLPSTTSAEAYGLVLGEGMAAGCVPVASNLPGVAEVAAATGLTVEPGSAQQLREALTRLCTDRALLEQLAAASSQRGGTMSIEATAVRYEHIFRDAVGQATGRQAQLALPEHWDDPELLLGEVARQLGVRRVSLSLFSATGNRNRNLNPVRVWRHGAAPMRVVHAPVARWVAQKDRPLLINPAANLERDLEVLLVRPEITSSIVLPVHRTRDSVSVIGLSTSAADGLLRLERRHIDLTMEILERLPAA
jgi:glycosyltransferase involved in cell wall biosynthesis